MEFQLKYLYEIVETLIKMHLKTILGLRLEVDLCYKEENDCFLFNAILYSIELQNTVLYNTFIQYFPACKIKFRNISNVIPSYTSFYVAYDEKQNYSNLEISIPKEDLKNIDLENLKTLLKIKGY